MKLNKIGIHVKRNTDGFLNTLLEIMKFEQAQSRPHDGGKLTEYTCLDNQTKLSLLEAEVKKSQAIELARKLQNR